MVADVIPDIGCPLLDVEVRVDELPDGYQLAADLVWWPRYPSPENEEASPGEPRVSLAPRPVENLFDTLDDLWLDLREVVAHVAPDPDTFVRISLRVPRPVEGAVWISARNRRWTIAHRLPAIAQTLPAPFASSPLRVLAADLSDRPLPGPLSSAQFERTPGIEIAALPSSNPAPRVLHLAGCRGVGRPGLARLEDLLSQLAPSALSLIVLDGGPGPPVGDSALLEQVLDVGVAAVLSHAGAHGAFFPGFYERLASRLPIDLSAARSLETGGTAAGIFRLWLRPGGELGLVSAPSG